MKDEKKAISPILKKMKVGDKETYSFRRFTSLKTTIERVQKESDKKFSYRTINAEIGSHIEVTRIS